MRWPPCSWSSTDANHPSLAVAPQVPDSIYYQLAPRRRIALRIFGNLLPIAIGPADGDRAISHRASGGPAHSSRRRVVCGLRLPVDARNQRSGGRRPSVRAWHRHCRRQPVVPDPLAGFRTLVGRRAVHRIGRSAVARSSAVLAVLYCAGALCSGSPDSKRDAGRDGWRHSRYLRSSAWP